MTGFSIRSLMLITLGLALFLSICTQGAASENLFHLILVLSFAIPGGSLGYDRNRTSRGVAIGTSVGAIAGTLAVSALVLTADWWVYMAGR